ncbi:hypothetical protein OGZ01_26020 [Vibrio harveyi]|nr:hypothetical protein [Vibrio harveyi]
MEAFVSSNQLIQHDYLVLAQVQLMMLYLLADNHIQTRNACLNFFTSIKG